MSKLQEISHFIEKAEKKLALYKFLIEHIPDIKMNAGLEEFSAKSVNKNYTNFDFIERYNSLYVQPYLDLDFEYNGITSKIRVSSSPKLNRLCYVGRQEIKKEVVADEASIIITPATSANAPGSIIGPISNQPMILPVRTTSAWSRRPSYENVIKFSRLLINLKTHKFKEDMLNSCRIKIMDFIRKFPSYKLDQKHLEPKLKKLLIFN